MFDNNNYDTQHAHAQHCEKCANCVKLLDTQQHVYATETEATASTPFNLIVTKSTPFADDTRVDRQRLWCIPWFILLNCLLQICLYLLASRCFHKLLMFNPALKAQYWRFLSYTLVHSDLKHLLLNVCLQCFVGLSLEYEQGHWKVAFIYIAGGISGSLATFIFQPQLSLLGASAGIYSLLISHVPHLVKNFSRLSYKYFRIVALIILWLSDAGFTAFHFLVNQNANPRICLDAHIAGGVAGLFFGVLIYSKWDRKKHVANGEVEVA